MSLALVANMIDDYQYYRPTVIFEIFKERAGYRARVPTNCAACDDWQGGWAGSNGSSWSRQEMLHPRGTDYTIIVSQSTPTTAADARIARRCSGIP